MRRHREQGGLHSGEAGDGRNIRFDIQDIPVQQPDILLLDEPTTGLDPRSKLDVQEVINELRDEWGATILLTTHDMKEADVLCDRVAIMDKGNVVAMDTPVELKKLVPTENGDEPTLEDVFLALTGKQLNPDETEKSA